MTCSDNFIVHALQLSASRLAAPALKVTQVRKLTAAGATISKGPAIGATVAAMRLLHLPKDISHLIKPYCN